jgi:hypothetical protein
MMPSSSASFGGNYWARWTKLFSMVHICHPVSTGNMSMLSTFSQCEVEGGCWEEARQPRSNQERVEHVWTCFSKGDDKNGGLTLMRLTVMADPLSRTIWPACSWPDLCCRASATRAKRSLALTRDGMKMLIQTGASEYHEMFLISWRTNYSVDNVIHEL